MKKNFFSLTTMTAFFFITSLRCLCKGLSKYIITPFLAFSNLPPHSYILHPSLPTLILHLDIIFCRIFFFCRQFFFAFFVASSQQKQCDKKKGKIFLSLISLAQFFSSSFHFLSISLFFFFDSLFPLFFGLGVILHPKPPLLPSYTCLIPSQDPPP